MIIEKKPRGSISKIYGLKKLIKYLKMIDKKCMTQK